MLSGASPSATSPRMALQGVRATATEIRAQRKKGLGRCRGRGFAGDQWLLVACGAPVCSQAVTAPADAEEKSPGSWTTGGNRDRARSQRNYRTVVEAPWAVAAGANQCNGDPGDRRRDSCARRDCPHRPFYRKRRRTMTEAVLSKVDLPAKDVLANLQKLAAEVR